MYNAILPTMPFYLKVEHMQTVRDGEIEKYVEESNSINKGYCNSQLINIEKKLNFTNNQRSTK